MSEVVASVVIGFKDWGLDRLERSIGSILRSFDTIPAEVIVSDYGSVDGGAVSSTSASAGARYIRTETDGTWSRSRALNAGFAVARGEQFFSTDADMIFAPGTLAAVSQRLVSFPHEAIILQCRDLPPGVGTDTTGQSDWSHYECAATLRPRWGMGGLVATRRELFERLRGYDERMHTYGGEDIDYAKRLRRLGAPINWLDRPGVRMYHVWHPSSRLAASLDTEAEAAVARNRRIHSHDTTTVRNRARSDPFEEQGHPTVSVIMAGDRPPSMVGAELSNILSQTIGNIEILLVDTHGQADRILKGLEDERIRTISPGGEWWHALSEAQGTYAMLHAPGSWSPANRLENLLDHTSARHVMPSDATVTAITSPEGELLALPVDPGTPRRRPWASLLLPTEIVRKELDVLPPGADDPHDLVYALLRSGLTVESAQGSIRVDVVDDTEHSEIQLDDLARRAQHLSRRLLAGGLSCDWLVETPSEPDAREALVNTQKLMTDRIDLAVWSSDEDLLELVVHSVGPEVPVRRCRITDASGQHIVGVAQTAGMPGAVARRLIRRSAASVSRGETRFEVADDDSDTLVGPPVSSLLQECSRLYAAEPDAAMWVVGRASQHSAAEAVMGVIQGLGGITVVLHRVIHEGQAGPVHLVLGLAGSKADALPSLLAVRSAAPEDVSVSLWLGKTHQGIAFPDLLESVS